MPVGETYARFVHRIWDRLQEQAGYAPTYIDATHIASYCPRCLDGTVMFRFTSHPKPTAFPASRGGGAGCCSAGCTAVEIAEALAR